jgi:hypothetical protein
MNIHSKIADKIQPFPGLPLFDWLPVAVHQAPSRAARKLAARYGLSLDHASTIVTLAGLCSDQEIGR